MRNVTTDCVDIKYREMKELGKKNSCEFVAEINGETYENEMIFRKLYGIINEEGWGILEPHGKGIYIQIGQDAKTFDWDNLTLTDPAKLQSQIQARVNNVKNWMASLTYNYEIISKICI